MAAAYAGGAIAVLIAVLTPSVEVVRRRAE
jgi:hypothetical protein